MMKSKVQSPKSKVLRFALGALLLALCALPAQAAPVRTAKGTVALKPASLPASASWTALSSVTITNGATIYVIFGGNNSWVPNGGITWNGNSLVQRLVAQSGSGGPAKIHIWTLDNVSGGTGDLVLNTGGGNWDTTAGPVAVIFSEVTQLVSTGSYDQKADGNSGSGTWTAPDTANTSTTAQADEFLVGAHVNKGPSGDTDVTTNAGDTTTKGQRVGTTGGSATSNVTVDEMYATVSSTGTFQHSWSGQTAREGVAGIITLKINTSAPARVPRLTTQRIGER
jgi:hypothetical protein